MLLRVCLAIVLFSICSTGFARYSKDIMAGQLLFVGIHGKSFNSSIKQKIKSIKPGGIILFGSNIKNTKEASVLIKKINNEYDRLNIPRPFIAVDQEGGYVTRIKTKPLLPSPALLGHLGDEEQIREISYQNSKLLRNIGFNMNFAPVLDVQSTHGNEFIGSRSFSKDPQEVGNMGERVVEGANEALVISTAKHFPGHGDVSVDSHKALPISYKNIPELESKEIIPYKEMIEENKLPAIMIGHIAFPKIDSKGLPASFSKKIIKDYLQKTLSYKGLIITDDIQMKGADISPDTKYRTRLSLDAGVDMVMLAWNPKAQADAYSKILSDLKYDQEFLKDSKEKFSKIIRLKSQYRILKNQNKEPIQSLLADKTQLGRSISSLFKKLNYNKIHNDYLKSNESFKKAPIIVFSKYKSFYRDFRGRAKNSRSLFFQLKKGFSHKRVRGILDKYKDSPIYFQLSNRRHANLFRSLSKKEKNRIFLVNSRPLTYVSNKWVIDLKTNLPGIGSLLGSSYIGHKKRAVANARPFSPKKKKKN